MGKRQKKSNEYYERLQVWQELLTRDEGVTYKEFNERTCEAYENSQLRGDIRNIKLLLKNEGVCLKEEGSKTKRYFLLDKSVDLLDLYNKSTRLGNSGEVLNLLTHMKGVFPNEFYQELCESFGKLMNEEENSNKYVDFETNELLQESLMYFSTIYSSISDKQAISITYVQINNKDNETTISLHPEFLKQYNSLWYVFGNAFDQQGNALGVTKVRLDLITDVNKLSDQFIPSGTDYDEYFDEIIGVENIPSVDIWHIEFLVKNNMFNRVLTNPLHEGSQRRCTRLDSIRSGYKGFTIDVKENIELLRKIMAYGSDIIILSPEKLKKKIQKILKKSLLNY